MLLGVQYYRPPTPTDEHWEGDMADIAAAGFDTVQLWVIWGWVEARRGTFDWSDYDRIMDSAHEAGLRVVLSTIAEMQPAWMLRDYPDAGAVDHLGRQTPSTTRVEAQVGITPGGSFDDPRVIEAMRTFLSETARHFDAHPALASWDVWNENRWAMESDGYLDYNPSTIESFRAWLGDKYGDLDGVAKAWGRRFSTWEDVQPGRKPGLPYTDLVEFQSFLSWRAAKHMRFRYDTIRAVDRVRPIYAHCGEPSVSSSGWEFEQAMSRGNDFELADQLDGYGCSSFPKVTNMSVLDLGVRIEATRAAAGQKPFWLSELQGGGGKTGLHVQEAVAGSEQQRWIWNGIARGAKGIIVWCWRDEVLGRESGGFGFIGNDGNKEERLRLLRETSATIRKHAPLFDGYMPDSAQVAVMFSPLNYEIEWAQEGERANQAAHSVLGWLKAFEELQVPYELVDPNHVDLLDDCEVLVLPWPLSIPDETMARIRLWVEAGGRLVTESELAAFDDQAFYRWPEDRPTAIALGIDTLGRRTLPDDGILRVTIAGREFALPTASWVEEYAPPAGSITLARHRDRTAAFSVPLGTGSIVALGTFVGLGHFRSPSEGFLGFVQALLTGSGVAARATVNVTSGRHLQWRIGRSGQSTLLFLVGEPDTTVTVTLRDEVPALIRDLVSDIQLSSKGGSFEVPLSSDGTAALVW